MEVYDNYLAIFKDKMQNLHFFLLLSHSKEILSHSYVMCVRAIQNLYATRDPLQTLEIQKKYYKLMQQKGLGIYQL